MFCVLLSGACVWPACVCVRTRVCERVRVCGHACVRACVCVRACAWPACVCVRTHVCERACACVCVACIRVRGLCAAYVRPMCVQACVRASCVSVHCAVTWWRTSEVSTARVEHLGRASQRTEIKRSSGMSSTLAG